jgi:thymidylate synthase ThyX
MDVILAGYNVDAEILEQLKRGEKTPPERVSPESVPAAYARISRDPRPIPELRAESREEVEAARRSNKNIIFGLGHKSVGNHANFNFDILGLSRLAVEHLQARRFGCGYTEKSQRYVTLGGDYVVPREYSPEDAARFRELVEKVQNRFYTEHVDRLVRHHMEANPELDEKARATAARGVPGNRNLALGTIEGWGKEDARYALGLATEAQIGTTFSATALEHAVRNMKYEGLDEVRELASRLFEATKEIAPSLILYTDSEIFEKSFKGRSLYDGHFKLTPAAMRGASARVLEQERSGSPAAVGFERRGDVTLIRCADIDTNVMAGILHANSDADAERCWSEAEALKADRAGGEAFMKEVLAHVSEFDDPPRHFELTDGLIFEVLLSSSAFAQLKRHRTMSLLWQDYDVSLGVTIPPSVTESGLAGELLEVCGRSAELHAELAERYGKAADYCLTNAHRRRALLATNPRQMNHFARLRCDAHAQWDIRQIAHDMVELAREIAPLSHLLTAGKDEFAGLHKTLYGE